MTDRELLEAAAKAAGLVFPRWCPAYECIRFGGDPSNPRDGWTWNPLTDDGDALRLFTRMPFCELYVSEIGATVFLPRKPAGEGPNLKCDEYANEHGGDLSAATRRAIVRAAAALA